MRIHLVKIYNQVHLTYFFIDEEGINHIIRNHNLTFEHGLRMLGKEK